MKMTTARIGGRHLRIVDWHWPDPLDTTYAARPPGRRWNPPGLPAGYPHQADAAIVPHSTCQPIGQAAYEAGLNGVDCRSAVADGRRELAWFPDTGTARAVSREPQPQWW